MQGLKIMDFMLSEQEKQFKRFCKEFAQDNPRAMSAFILEKGMPGLSVAQRLKVIAPHDLVRLKYENVFVPRENLLGEVGQGFNIAMQTLELFRMTVGAAALGIGQAAFDSALHHVKKRVQFGKPLAEFQVTQIKLADMATELDAARALVYRAAILKERRAGRGSTGVHGQALRHRGVFQGGGPGGATSWRRRFVEGLGG